MTDIPDSSPGRDEPRRPRTVRVDLPRQSKAAFPKPVYQSRRMFFWRLQVENYKLALASLPPKASEAGAVDRLITANQLAIELGVHRRTIGYRVRDAAGDPVLAAEAERRREARASMRLAAPLAADVVEKRRALKGADVKAVSAEDRQIAPRSALRPQRAPQGANPFTPRAGRRNNYNEIATRMRADMWEGLKLEDLSQYALAVRYGAAPSTCVKALIAVLASPAEAEAQEPAV
jgi:hypothetical protein